MIQREYDEQDFCTREQGFTYVFSKLSAIYGASFLNHWKDVDPQLVKQTWIEILGERLTYRPVLDAALNSVDGKWIPSAAEFKNVLYEIHCIIPFKRDFLLPPPKPEPVYIDPEQVEESKRKVKEFIKTYAKRNSETHN